jgi:hypothetical protein
VSGAEPIRRPSAVWLGDAVRACSRLHADHSTAEQVLELLGLSASAAGTAQTVTDDEPVHRSAKLPPVPTRPAATITVPTVRQAFRGQPPAELEAADTPVVEQVAPEPTRASAAPRRLPKIADVLQEPTASLPSGSDSLLPPTQQRAILSALCRSPAATGDIDVDELVERIARGEPVRRLPLTAAPTTRRGIQVLVDFGDGMRPFIRDQEELVEALEHVAGPDGFEVLRFAGCPLDEAGAGPGPIWTWRPYLAPLAGQPVIVLSDFGAGVNPSRRWALQQQWLGFATALHAAGNQMVGLAPVPGDRLPAELRATLPILTWDRTIRVTDAVLAVGRQVAGPRRASW